MAKLVTTIDDEYQLQELFAAYNRDYYTMDGYRAIYNYLDSMYSDDEYFEVDVIGLCGDFTEYSNLSDLYNEYGHIYDYDINDEEFNEDDFISELEYRTYVCRLDNGHILIETF